MLEVLELRFFEDKDFKEIAFILNITESGAKMRTYRALDRLRKNFNLSIKYDGKKWNSVTQATAQQRAHCTPPKLFGINAPAR